YATLAFATDYDCWHATEEDVSVDAILAILRQNAQLAQGIVRELTTRLPDPAASPAATALTNAVITAPDHLAPATRARLRWLSGQRLEVDDASLPTPAPTAQSQEEP